MRSGVALALAVLGFRGIPVEQVSQLAEALTGELPLVREVRLVEAGRGLSPGA
jgi:hypothetical protein